MKKILVLGITALMLLSITGLATADFAITRDLPDSALPNTVIDVTVSFTPDANLLAVGTNDSVPFNTEEEDTSWCTPEADIEGSDGDGLINYGWYELASGTATTALYKVDLTGVSAGTYTFSGYLSYRTPDGVKHKVDIGGDYELEVLAGIQINGTIYEVNEEAEPNPIADATVTLLHGSTTVATTTSNGDGEYELLAPSTGDYTIEVSKTGYATESQDVSMTTAEAITMNFRYNSGLIPEDPSFDYVLDCVWLWKGPGLINFDKVLDVVFYWKS